LGAGYPANLASLIGLNSRWLKSPQRGWAPTQRASFFLECCFGDLEI